MKLKTYFFILTLSTVTGLMLPSAHAKGYKDKDSGCRLVLCLANPNGPMAVAECVHDVKAYFNWIRRPKKFPSPPSCDSAKEKGAYFQHTYDHYGLCPEGMKDIPSPKQNNQPTFRVMSQANFNQWLDSATAMQGVQYKQAENRFEASSGVALPGLLYSPTPRGYPYYSMGSSMGGAPTAWGKTPLGCTPNPQNYKTVNLCRWINSPNDPAWRELGSSGPFTGPRCVPQEPIRVYSQIAYKPFKESPAVVDVYVDHKPWHRARLNGDFNAADTIESTVDTVELEGAKYKATPKK